MNGHIETAEPLRVMVIGDPHVGAGESALARSRWVAAARFACRQRPDAIVWIGDHWDLDCLNRKSKSRGGTGRSARAPRRTFLQEIEAGREAIEAFLGEIKRYNARASRSGRGAMVYRPRLVFCMGNHEMRINEAGGQLEEFVDLLDVDTWITKWLRARGFEVVPFLDVVTIGGVDFTHYVEHGPMRNAVGIANAAKLIGRSTVWGHTHFLGYAERPVKRGGWDKWLCLPTFKDPGRLESGQQSAVVLLDDVKDGDFMYSLVSTDRLLRDYGPLYRAAA